MRVALWPRRSFSRSAQYFIKRVLRLTATPHAIAAGVAAGVMASWTPLIGFHFVLAFAIAYLIAGNMGAAAIGTAFGNPLSFPFIWAVTLKTGNYLLGGDFDHTRHSQVDLEALFRRLDMSQLWEPVLKPMLIGSLPLAIVSGLLFYAATYWSVQSFQARRRVKLAEKARARAEQAMSEGRTV